MRLRHCDGASSANTARLNSGRAPSASSDPNCRGDHPCRQRAGVKAAPRPHPCHPSPPDRRRQPAAQSARCRPGAWRLPTSGVAVASPPSSSSWPPSLPRCEALRKARRLLRCGGQAELDLPRRGPRRLHWQEAYIAGFRKPRTLSPAPPAQRQAHASTGVLVIDCTAFGDVSRLLLGGRQPHVKAAVGERHADGKSTAHLMSHLLSPSAAASAAAVAAPLTPGRTSARGAASLAAGGALNIAERFGLPVREVSCLLGGWCCCWWPRPLSRQAAAAEYMQHASHGVCCCSFQPSQPLAG